MSELNKENILKKSKQTYDELFYEASKLSRLIEDLDMNEETIDKDDIEIMNEMPTLSNTEYDTIYQYENKLYKKVSGDYDDKVLCYTDIFMELVEVNNKLVQLSGTLEDLEEFDKEEEK